MNREIKFRGKSVGSPNWVYGFYLQNKAGEAFIRSTENFETYWVLEETLGEFTTRHDKNKKEIYEGDIVKLPYSPLSSNPNIIEYFDIGVVVFPFYVQMKFKCSKILDEEKKLSHHRNRKEVYTLNGKQDYISRDALFDSRIEVIGNIHDNPELLEKMK